MWGSSWRVPTPCQSPMRPLLPVGPCWQRCPLSQHSHSLSLSLCRAFSHLNTLRSFQDLQEMPRPSPARLLLVPAAPQRPPSTHRGPMRQIRYGVWVSSRGVSWAWGHCPAPRGVLQDPGLGLKGGFVWRQSPYRPRCADKGDTAGKRAREGTRGWGVLEREQPWGWSSEETQESPPEQLNYCLMRERNWGTGGAGADLAPKGTVTNHRVTSPRLVTSTGNPSLAQSLSPLSLPCLFHLPGCVWLAPALLHAPNTVPGRHRFPLCCCAGQKGRDRAGEGWMGTWRGCRMGESHLRSSGGLGGAAG